MSTQRVVKFAKVADNPKSDPTAEIRRYLTRRSETDPEVFRVPASLKKPQSVEEVLADHSLRLSRAESAVNQLQAQLDVIMTELFWMRQTMAIIKQQLADQLQGKQEQAQPTIKRRKTGQPKTGMGYVEVPIQGSGPHCQQQQQPNYGMMLMPQQPIPGMIWMPRQMDSGMMWVPQMQVPIQATSMVVSRPLPPPSQPPTPLRRSPRTVSFKRKNEESEMEGEEMANTVSTIGSRVMRAARRRIPRGADDMEISYV